MTSLVDSTSTLRTVSKVQRIDASGTLREVSKIQLVDADSVLRTVSGAFGFTATASPLTSVGNGYSGSSIQVITATTITVTVSGGVPPYTYSWVPVDGTWTATFPTSDSTRFLSPALSPGDVAETLFTCTVTDSAAAAASVDSNSVTARARNNA